MIEDKKIMKKTYPLLPYSQLVWDMMQTDSDIYMFRNVYRLKGAAKEREKIEKAIIETILSHPVFSMRVDVDGQQYYAPLENPLHGQFHNMEVSVDGTDLLLLTIGSRILGDGLSGVLLAEDIVRAYHGEKLEKDCYFEYLEQVEQTKLTERYKRNRLWLEQKFNTLTAPVRPTTDYPLNISEQWLEGEIAEDWSAELKAINRTVTTAKVPLTGIVALATAMAIMDYNNTDSAAITWAYSGRDTAVQEHIYGSLHRDIPLLIRRDSRQAVSQEDLLRQVRREMREGIAHSSYPFTLTKPHTEVWNYAVNVIEQPVVDQQLAQLPFEVEIQYEPTKQRKAYALMDVEIYRTEDKLAVVYRYSATHYKVESVEIFAAMVKNNLVNLLNL